MRHTYTHTHLYFLYEIEKEDFIFSINLYRKLIHVHNIQNILI